MKKKDALLDKYVRVINKLQQQLKQNGISQGGTMDFDTASVSMHELDKSKERSIVVGDDAAQKVPQTSTGQTQPLPPTPALSGRLPAAGIMSTAMAGSTLTTYRKPPPSATAPTHSTSTIFTTGTLPAGGEGSSSIHPPVAPIQRSSSGTYRPHSQQPRNKHPSAATMEMLHRSTYMNSSSNSSASTHQK